MKNVIIFFCVLISVLTSCSSSVSGSEETASEACIELKVIERAVVNGKCSDELHILANDGTTYHHFIYWDDDYHLAQKGDTVVIKDGRVVDVKFCR